MDQIRRENCAILPLVLKGKWYDMIASGAKREEYRLATPYWRVRLANWTAAANRLAAAEFRRGYARAAHGILVHRR